MRPRCRAAHFHTILIFRPLLKLVVSPRFKTGGVGLCPRCELEGVCLLALDEPVGDRCTALNRCDV